MLETLDLSACDQITDGGLKELGGLTRLQFLNLSSCDQVTDVGLNKIATLLQLQALDLSACDRVTDSGLRELRALTRLESLNLSAAGVALDGDKGVLVDEHLRTTNRRVFAAGDVTSLGVRFTHAADAMARVVLRNALFAGRATFDPLTIPRCTFTDPEVAAVGDTGPGNHEWHLDFRKPLRGICFGSLRTGPSNLIAQASLLRVLCRSLTYRQVERALVHGLLNAIGWSSS